MGIIDIVFLIILVIAFISGMQKGLITSALACVAMLGAVLIAQALEGRLANAFQDTSFSAWLLDNFNGADATRLVDWSNWFHTLSFVIVFVLAYAALMLIVNLINNVFRIPKLKAVDGLLGGILGLVRGYVVIVISVAAAKILLSPLESEGSEFISPLLNDSLLGRFFNKSESALSDLFGVGKMMANLK